jgi:hypothetical protein
LGAILNGLAWINITVLVAFTVAAALDDAMELEPHRRLFFWTLEGVPCRGTR